MKTEIREYNEKMVVETAIPSIDTGVKTDRLCIIAYNEAGCNCTIVDLLDVLQWCKDNDIGIQQCGFKTSKMILDRENIVIKGEGTLWNYRGYEITNSYIVAERVSPPLQEFDATGILFRECAFKNCLPCFREPYDGDSGCIGCQFDNVL